MKVKTFIRALSYYPHDIKRLAKCVGDQRLTQVEKKILRGYILLRDRKFDELIRMLRLLSSPDCVVESQRELVMAIAYNNMGSPREAIPHIERAKVLLETVLLPREQFLVRFHAGIAYLNLKDRDNVERILDSFDEYPPVLIVDRISMHRLQFHYFSMIGDLEKTARIFQIIESLACYMNELQVAGWWIDAFTFHLKQRRFEDCWSVLEKMKSSRKYYPPENVLFMKTLLAFIGDEAPLYLYPHVFDGRPLLYHQIQVLLAYERRDFSSAKTHWQSLTAISPEIYQNDFHYAGDECLFSMAFDKLQEKNHIEWIPSRPDQEVVSPMDVLSAILYANIGKAISKDELFRDVYGKDPESKDEMNKLTCAMKRIRKKFDLEIQTRKGCFIATLKKTA